MLQDKKFRHPSLSFVQAVEKGLPPSPGVTAQPVLGMFGYYTPRCSSTPGVTAGDIVKQYDLGAPYYWNVFTGGFPVSVAPSSLALLGLTVTTACNKTAL